MRGVIRANHPDMPGNFLEGAESEQSARAAIMTGETGLLGDHRPARGEVARGTVAKPSGLQPHILVFGNREFAERALDIFEVGVSGTGSTKRQPWERNSSRVSISLMSVASSNVSPERSGAAAKRRNSSDLLHKYFSPRQTISF